MLECQRPKRRKREPIKTLRDGREICQTATGWSQRRKELYKREQGKCQNCKVYAPLHNTGESFSGHAHHKFGRKRKDDRLEVLVWLCGFCHAREHQPLKVLPHKLVIPVVKEEAA